jgi:hypothetical protein
MRYSLPFFLLLALLSGSMTLTAAGKLDFATVDMLTFRCYQENKWDSVILVGKQALRQDIDYYYLRVRMGISYYNKSDYFHAATHLEKARQFNSEDPLVANYLYYAYLYSNRKEEAAVIHSFMTEEARKSATTGKGFLQEAHVEAGMTLSSDKSPDNLGTMMGNDSIYGERDLYGNSSYSDLALKMKVSNRVSLSLAYNYLNFSKTKYIQYGHAEAHLDTIVNNEFSNDYFYSYPWTIRDTSFKYNVYQHEGYLSANIVLPWGIKIVPAVHLLHVKYAATSPRISADSASDIAYYRKADSSYHMFSYPAAQYSFDKTDTSFNNWVVSLGLSKDFGIFNLGLNGSWSNLNGRKQKQAGISLTYFPFGNLNFYGTTIATGFFQGKDKRLLLGQVLGAKITPWMWAEANFYYGDYTNANIFNGSIVYNNSDIIDYRGGANLVFLVGKHMSFSLIYQYFRKESQQIYYIKSNEQKQTKTNPYNTNTIIGGFTWKF